MESFQILSPAICFLLMLCCKYNVLHEPGLGTGGWSPSLCFGRGRNHGAPWYPPLSVASLVCRHLTDKQMASLMTNLIFLKC